jgi:hypothetical protein
MVFGCAKNSCSHAKNKLKIYHSCIVHRDVYPSDFDVEPHLCVALEAMALIAEQLTAELLDKRSWLVGVEVGE